VLSVSLSVMSVSLMYCGQAAGWIKMPLGTEVGLSPSDIVLGGNPALPTVRGTAAPPVFDPCLLWPNGRPSQQLLSSCSVRDGHPVSVVCSTTRWFVEKDCQPSHSRDLPGERHLVSLGMFSSCILTDVVLRFCF